MILSQKRKRKNSFHVIFILKSLLHRGGSSHRQNVFMLTCLLTVLKNSNSIFYLFIICVKRVNVFDIFILFYDFTV